MPHTKQSHLLFSPQTFAMATYVFCATCLYVPCGISTQFQFAFMVKKHYVWEQAWLGVWLDIGKALVWLWAKVVLGLE